MDALKFTIIYIVTLLVPFWFVNKGLFYFFLIVGAVLGIMEYGSYLTYRKTLSQRFWDESERNKIIGISALSIFYVYLLAHLIFRI